MSGRLPTQVAAGLVGVVLAACGSDPDPTASTATGRNWPTRPIVHAGSLIADRLPQVEYQGGPFLRNPRIVTVTFTIDDPALVARLERFGDVITSTRWWREVVDSYCARPGDCIGQGSSDRHVRLDESLSAKVRDVEVEELLAGQARIGRLGPIGPDTLVLAYLPAGVSLSDAAVPRYCRGGPRAYHRAIDGHGLRFAYAVIARCGDEHTLTATASHEILEASTNPDPHRRGFAFRRDSANAGFTASGVEPVDPCGLITQDNHWTTQSGFAVQRAWSNRAAALGHDPCVPAPADDPYIALVPRQPAGRLAEVGDQVTITLDAVSDSPVSAWEVSTTTVAEHRPVEPCVRARLDKSQVTRDETARVTITLLQRNNHDLCVVGLVSSIGRRAHLWPLAVVTR